MARRSISIDEKIEQQKRIELKNKELLKAIENSNRSFDEIMAFLGSNDEAEE